MVNRVVHRADDRHRADADGEGCGGEAIDEAGVAFGMALHFQPLAEALKVALDIQDLAGNTSVSSDSDKHFFCLSES